MSAARRELAAISAVGEACLKGNAAKSRAARREIPIQKAAFLALLRSCGLAYPARR